MRPGWRIMARYAKVFFSQPDGFENGEPMWQSAPKKRWSAYGPKQTSLVASHMPAFGGKADIGAPDCEGDSLCKHHPRADIDTAVQVHDVRVVHADATRGH